MLSDRVKEWCILHHVLPCLDSSAQTTITNQSMGCGPPNMWQWTLQIAVYLLLRAAGSLAWETKAEALKQAVQLLHDPNVFGVSTLSTRYPDDHPVSDLAGHVISGPEYFAPCDSETGSLLYLGLTVSQSWRNILNDTSKNATVSIASNANPEIPDPRHRSRQHPNHWHADRPSWRRGMPSKSRVTLFGHFSILNITEHPNQADEAACCYLDHHADASHWAPNSTESPHVPFWATFNINKVYWVGGFGDEHYIGWFTSDEWNTAWRQHAGASFSRVDGLAFPFRESGKPALIFQ